MITHAAIDAAKRVTAEHRQRAQAYTQAYTAWEVSPLLWRAIIRDDAKTALLELSDANVVALALLAEVRT